MMKFTLIALLIAYVAAVTPSMRHGPPGELPSVEHIRNQQADQDSASNMVSYHGTTRFRPRFARAGLDCQEVTDNEGFEKTRWSSKGFEVSQDGQYQILSAQRFDGVVFLYKENFLPVSAPEACIIGNDQDEDRVSENDVFYSSLDVALERGVRYIIVTTGVSNHERGRFQNYIWGPAGSEVYLEEKGCAEVGCDDDSFTETCACDSSCEALCDCCYDYCATCGNPDYDWDDSFDVESSDVEDNNTSQCGNVAGDPHYTGFGGEQYDVRGESGKMYNLLSDHNILVNARYDDGCKPDSTVMTEIGIMYDDHELIFDASGVHQLNGQSIMPGQRIYLNNERTAWAERHHDDGLRLATPDYTIDAKVKDSKCSLTHIDVITQRRNPNSAPHGLLGQTASTEAKRSLNGGAIEGTFVDYEVSHIFGSDHVYNRFGVNEAPAPYHSERV